MFKSLLPWKHIKTKVIVPEQTMEDEDVLPKHKLVACDTCGRTFLPLPLKKHAPVCEKNASKRRKVFDSLKQRIEGTDLAQFHQKSFLKKQEPQPAPKPVERPKSQNKWEENHQKLVDAIRSAKGASKDMPLNKKHQPAAAAAAAATTTTTTAATSSNGRCPFCDRQFGHKAFDRHVEWCKEHRTRVQKSPANVLLAKERLEARTKYKVPPLNKSKKIFTVKEKYSNPNTVNRSESICSVRSTPPPPRRTPTITKPKSVLDLGKRVESQSKINKTISVDEIKKSKEQNKTSASAPYDPFVSAERQLMELLECDDFKQLTKPFIHTQRPHTTGENPLKVPSKKLMKSAENSTKKRASVIDPPASFQDTDPDDFELLENLINDQFNNDNKFYLDKRAADELDVILNRRKFSDELSSIDSNLINENDNLSIPEHFRRDDYSPGDTDTTIQNDNVDLYSLQCDRKIKPQTRGKVRKNSKTKTKSNSSGNAAKVQKRAKNPSLEPFPNYGSIDNLLAKKKTKDNADKVSEPAEESVDLNVKAEDLFAVDDKMYAEYKIYEEMYLKEKEHVANSKKQRTKNSIKSYGIEIMNEEHANQNKISDDSAYGSLNRTTPIPKAQLSPLQRKRIDSASSSSSENFTNPPVFCQQRMSKFCHECGNKYPLQTAKFCVECGVKRLLL